MECVELAPAVGCVARFESGSKLHALHTLRAVWFRLRRAEDRRALHSAQLEAVCSRGLILRRWFHLPRFCAFSLDTGHSYPSLRRPTQAVILAGGRGERLRPFTDIRPKPMLEIHGKPFLDYLITMLRIQGFDRVVLLLGYMPEVVQDYFGNGSRWGVQIV